MNLIQRIINKLARITGLMIFRMMDYDSRVQLFDDVNKDLVKTIKVDTDQIKFHTPSRVTLKRADTLFTKEVDTIQWIDTFSADNVFWDIGANVGVYSLYAAIRRSAKVYAFEPSAINYHVLTRNIIVNKLENDVTAYLLAFSDEIKPGVLNMPSLLSGGSMNQFGNSGDRSPYWKEEVKGMKQDVIGTTIDDFIKTYQPAFPTHLKIDVDGLELPILNGAKNTLRDAKLKSIMVELSLTDKNENNVATMLLESDGFELKSVGNIQSAGSKKAANHLFIRPG